MDYLSEYNPIWPEWFLEIEAYLKKRLQRCLRIEHVGSTSIPGMVAKPIIDIDVVVENGTMPAMIETVELAGYEHRGDLGIAGREAFKQITELTLSLPLHHLYVCEVSSPELHKHISFREYLRHHPDTAAQLSQFKRHLAIDLRLNRAEYIEAKAPLVNEIAASALKWFIQLRN